MKTNLLHTILIALIANCFFRDINTNIIIFRGYREEISRVPYLAQVLEDQVHVCGASIISDKWLVSAAHCFQIFPNIKGIENFAVITGSNKRGIGGQTHKIDKIIVHKEYDARTVENDISLIKLNKQIIFNGFQKQIRIGKRTLNSGEKIKIAGFGKLEDLRKPTNLRAAVVPIVNAEECKSRYKNYTKIHPDEIKSTMFCAGIGDSDVCEGDSGGPAVFNNKLVGIISFNVECASENIPTVYTQLPLFRKWIRDQTGLEV